MCIKCFEKLPRVYFPPNKKEYLIWQDDKFCTVCFSEIPDIGNKEINKNVMTENEINKAKEKPLYLKNNVSVLLIDKKKEKTYGFTINKGYDYDGASIARIFWRLIGSKENIEFKVAALVHDVLCENHTCVDNDRYFADKVFERLLEAGGVPAFKRFMMFHSVDNFQKICGDWQ